MANPHPKPEPYQKRPRQRLKAKSKLKQGRGNPFPDHIKKQVYNEQGGVCCHPGCTKEITDFHHRRKKQMGSSYVSWIHDRRNCAGLCWEHHRWTEEEIYWLLFYEAAGAAEFGWWAGEDISLAEWVERNEWRLAKARVDVEKLIKEVKESVIP